MKSLIKKLEDQLTESESSQFDVGEQRERNHRYYTLQALGNEVKGRSQYIDPTVLDSVESKKALFDETFLSNRQTVKFRSSGAQPPGEADAKTAYVMETLRKNGHEQLFRDGWHDALVAKRMVVTVHWKEDTKETYMPLQGTHPQQMQALIAQRSQQEQIVDINTDDLQQDEQGLLNGSLTVSIDDSYAEIELVQPERYYRDPFATYPGDAQWNTVESDVPRGTLILDGYDEEQVMGLSVDYRFRSDEEDAARKAHDQTWTRRMQFDRANHQQHVTVYRTWTWCNLMDEELYDSLDLDLGFEPADEIKLYEIHWAHGEVLKWSNGKAAIREADECCFFEWTEYKISHAEMGLCTADVHAHAQKTNSTLKRLILDNQQMRNNTRWEAAIGALKNPRDLLDNRIGGVVWSRQVGSVAPLATPELSPLTFNVLEMMQRDTDRRDGYSSLGKGMNDDAVKYQNADSMIERLTKAGTKRPMKSARSWAQDFLVPMCQYVVRLGMRHDQSRQQLEVKGKVIPVIPSQWQDDELSMDVAVALTPEEGKVHAQSLLMLHSLMQQDPDLQQLYKVEQKHALMDEVFDALGVPDTTPYMMRPDSPEFQQAKQQAQQVMQMEQQKQDFMMKTQVELAQSGDRRAWEEFKWSQSTDMDKLNQDADKLSHEATMDGKNYSLEEEKFDHDSEMDQAELEIERQQKRPASVG